MTITILSFFLFFFPTIFYLSVSLSLSLSLSSLSLVSLFNVLPSNTACKKQKQNKRETANRIQETSSDDNHL